MEFNKYFEKFRLSGLLSLTCWEEVVFIRNIFINLLTSFNFHLLLYRNEFAILLNFTWIHESFYSENIWFSGILKSLFSQKFSMSSLFKFILTENIFSYYFKYFKLIPRYFQLLTSCKLITLIIISAFSFFFFFLNSN